MQYYYSNNGVDQKGPFELGELQRQGVTAQTLVWYEGLANWTPAGQLPELASIFAQTPVRTEPPVTSYQPPAGYPGPEMAAAVGSQPMQYQAYNANRENNAMAIASLVLGIVGLVTMGCFVMSALAVVFGHIAKGQLRRGQGTGDGMATAGLVMGYIGAGIGLVIWVIYIVAIAVVAANGGR